MVVSNIFNVHPYLGKISNLTNICQMGWNHQLDWWATSIHSLHPLHVQCPVGVPQECYPDHCASGWCEPNLKWREKNAIQYPNNPCMVYLPPNSPYYLAKCRHIYTLHGWGYRIYGPSVSLVELDLSLPQDAADPSVANESGLAWDFSEKVTTHPDIAHPFGNPPVRQLWKESRNIARW